ncbi:MAG: GH116 family glycosyl-hydrolase [Phycisphaerae bacterium]
MSESNYTDAFACRNAGMPLGGIGAGSLDIRPAGYFHGWYLMNNKPWGAGPETDQMERLGLRFGLRYRLEDGQAAGLALGEHIGLDPNIDGWFWMSDPYHLPWIRHPQSIDFQANVPFARLGYRFGEDVPVGVSLKAWSPLIPHDEIK